MPTTATHTFTRNRVAPLYRPSEAMQVHFKFPNSTTIVAGTVLGEITASPGSVKAYASGSADGSQVPIGIAAYDVTVDGSGNHSWAGGFWGETDKSAPVFIKGHFRTTDLTGLDANAITTRNIKLVSGTVADGVCEVL